MYEAAAGSQADCGGKYPHSSFCLCLPAHKGCLLLTMATHLSQERKGAVYDSCSEEPISHPRALMLLSQAQRGVKHPQGFFNTKNGYLKMVVAGGQMAASPWLCEEMDSHLYPAACFPDAKTCLYFGAVSPPQEKRVFQSSHCSKTAGCWGLTHQARLVEFCFLQKPG